jgi:hypothetical protein
MALAGHPHKFSGVKLIYLIDIFNLLINNLINSMKKPGNANKKLITRCPFCSDELAVSRLSCRGCNTQIDSELSIPPFFRLPPDLQDFVLVFLRCQGTIREVEKELGISYPTVCKRLALVNELLGNNAPRINRTQVLEQLERGEITVQEATQLLKERTS